MMFFGMLPKALRWARRYKRQLLYGTSVTAIALSVLIIAILVVTQGTALEDKKQNASPYCHINTCPKNSHTMCQYPIKKLNKTCGKCSVVGLQPPDTKTILQIHNDYRRYGKYFDNVTLHYLGLLRKTLKGKFDMPEMKWDKELAMIAQRWSMQCPKKKDQCRNTAKMRCGQIIDSVDHQAGRLMTPVGITYFHYTRIGDAWEKCVDEKSKKKTMNEKQAEAFARALMTNSRTIGCGYLKCDSEIAYLVCNHGPMPHSLIANESYSWLEDHKVVIA